MTEKPFDSFFMLVFLVVGAIMLVAGFVMGQPTRIVLGVLFVIMGLLSLVAFDSARKRRRR
jgi:Flp pilus assembly protein TadB